MKKWRTLLLVVLMITLLAGCTPKPAAENENKSDDSENSKMPEQFIAAEATYPQMAPYPNEAEFVKDNGDFDDEGFDKVYDAWRSDKDAQSAFAEQFSGDYRSFYSKTSRVILQDGEQINQVYSPISLYMALAMLSETTAGESQEQILNLLGSAKEKMTSDAKALWNANYSADTASNSVLANSLWLDKDLAYQKATVDQLADGYYASIFQGTMGSQEYNKKLQNWINQQTGDLLTEESKSIEFSEETVLGLVSTVNFQQKWSQEFSRQNNIKASFYGKNEETEVEFMRQSGNDTYYWTDNFAACNKPLLDGSSSMWFVLPDEDAAIEDVLANEQLFALTSTTPGNSDWKNKKDLKVNLSVPKFDISAHYDLSEPLKSLGMTAVFDQETADFSPLLKDLSIPVWLSAAEQGTRVAIDEEGVTAASFTAMKAAGAAEPLTEEIDFVLDRPFIFIITGITGDPIFIGVVNQL